MISSADELIQKKQKAFGVFIAYVAVYVGVLLLVTVWMVAGKRYDLIWFGFAFGIGAIYVFMAFSYFYGHYLKPCIVELEKAAREKQEKREETMQRIITCTHSIYLWPLNWIVPALVVQLLVIVFFWMTTAAVPFDNKLYTHPFMYGQIYQKAKNYVGPEIVAAGLSKKIDDVDPQIERDVIMKKAQFLEMEFAGYLTNANIPEIKSGESYDNDYVKAVTNMMSVIYKVPFIFALTFAFLGTLMYTLNNLLYRYFITDLYPKSFVSYIVRFLFAPAICMVIAYFMSDDWLISSGPVLFFLVGFFPQVALRYMEEKTRERLKLKKDEKEEVPLGLIQGMTDYNIYRLKELGIGDAQNLAYSDINYLRKNWYNDRQLADFIAQAILLIHLRKDFATLQNSGIRNIIAFKHILEDKRCEEKDCLQFADSLGVKEKEKIRNLCLLIQSSPMKERIDVLDNVMRRFDEREMREITSS